MEKELPIGWINIILEDLYFHVTGGDWGLDPETIGAEGFSKVVCIRGGELKNWRVDKGKTASIRLVKDSSLNTRRLRIGDILLEISGGGPDQPVGRTVIIDEEVFKNHPELPKVCTNFLRLVRLVDVINKQYINHYLQYFYSSGEIVKYQGGSNNLRNLKFGDYSSIKIPLPPLPEQQRIVAKLDTLFGHLDALKTRLDRIPQLLKDFRQKVLTQAVTGKLTEGWREEKELEEWENKKLDDISERITVGYVGKMIDQYSDSGIPFLRSQNVRAFRFSDINLLYISAEFNEEIKKSKLYPGDVVIVRSGYPGTTCVIPETLVEANCSDILICTPKKKRLNPHFVSIFMNSDYGKEIVFQGRVGNAQQHFNTKTLKTTIIPLPPLVEQQEIVRRVESLFAKADQIEASYQKLKAKIEQLPQALLAKAFRGELVEQLPTDGDARELLEQIKLAKEGLEKGGKGRKMKMEEEMNMAAEPRGRYGKRKNK